MSWCWWLIIPLIFRRRWMNCYLREWLHHLLVVLVSILACLLFLSILVASGPYLTLSGLIIICIYHLLRCILSDICGSLFNMLIMLSRLIYRMLIYIFQLLSIIIISYDLFGTTCLILGRFYLLGWPQPLLNLFCSCVIARVSVLLSISMTSWSWFALSGQVRGLANFCVPYWFSLDYILKAVEVGTSDVLQSSASSSCSSVLFQVGMLFKF